jgi:hypothetical protein
MFSTVQQIVASMLWIFSIAGGSQFAQFSQYRQQFIAPDGVVNKPAAVVHLQKCQETDKSFVVDDCVHRYGPDRYGRLRLALLWQFEGAF